MALMIQYNDNASISVMLRLDLPRMKLCANLTRGMIISIAMIGMH
jgi:hypothetical protein